MQQLKSPSSLARPSHQILDFLAPRYLEYSRRHSTGTNRLLQQRSREQRRTLSTTSSVSTATASTSPISPTTSTIDSVSPTASSTSSATLKPAPPFTPSQRAFLDSALRVNQAGELAATLIYQAQTPPLVRAHAHLRPLLTHMHAQEAGHLRAFNTLVAQHRVRPTVLTPAWRAAATLLGWATGVGGREVAMACTEAVETEIGGHYNEQVRELLGWVRERERRGEELGDELAGLVALLKKVRDEELEHLDVAVEQDAKLAEGYPVLTGVIRAGCRGAIWLSQRI